MTAAHPDTVARAIVEMVTHDAKPLLETYRWAYNIAHGASGGGDGVRTASGGPTDQVGTIATNKGSAQLRRQLTRTSRRLLEISSEMRAIESGLRKAMGESRREYEPVQQPADRDALVTRAEQAGSIEAKARREARGEGWGGAVSASSSCAVAEAGRPSLAWVGRRGRSASMADLPSS